MTPAETKKLVKKIAGAKLPESVFGDLGDNGHRPDRLKEKFREMAFALHPDRHPGKKDIADAMASLTSLREVAEIRLARNLYGTKDKAPEPVTLKARYTYLNVVPLAAGDVCDVYSADYFDKSAGKMRKAAIKLVRDHSDNDLAENEVLVLKKLWGAASPEDVKVFGKYLPKLVETANITVGRVRKAVILRQPMRAAYTLSQVKAAYPTGVDLRTGAWMFRRMLEILEWVHRQGFVHGAVVPEHFLIKPEDHGGKLLDFSYAVEIGKPLKAISSAREKFYPPEVFAKRGLRPATDVYMAARCFQFLLGDQWVDPNVTALVNTCLLGLASRTPSAMEIYDKFTKILERLYGKPKFFPFQMPPP